MAPEALLWIGVLLLVTAGVVVAYVLVAGGDVGVARSLSLIERQVSEKEVGRNELSANDRFVTPVMNALRGLGARLAPSGTANRLNRGLEMAGNPPAWNVDRLLGIKGAGLVIGVVLGLLFGRLSVVGLVAAAVLGASLFFLPDLLVYNSGIKRQEDVRNGLADALDLLTLCVEAGQAFNAAMLQVSRSVQGPIAGEFSRVLAEIQIGKSRAEAFASLSKRTTADEIKTFVTAITQADRLGLPLGSVLREQAKEMRVRRRQLAEEKAQKVPVKVVFPMILFIFPALFIVVIGPGVISIAAAFSNGF